MKPTNFFGSTIGKKIVMAATGLLLFGFVIAHMIGNLQVYLGRATINEYSVTLHHLLHGGGLWIARGGLLVAVALHIWSAASLTLTNRAARPQGYREFEPQVSTYASRTMRWSGVLLLAFIIFHLLHLTTGTLHPQFVEGDVYSNLIIGLRVVPVAIFYLIAMLALGMHLYHGAWSMLQTLGLNHPRWNHLRFAVCVSIAAVVVIGNLTFPATILLGIIS